MAEGDKQAQQNTGEGTPNGSSPADEVEATEDAAPQGAGVESTAAGGAAVAEPAAGGAAAKSTPAKGTRSTPAKRAAKAPAKAVRGTTGGARSAAAKATPAAKTPAARSAAAKKAAAAKTTPAVGGTGASGASGVTAEPETTADLDATATADATTASDEAGDPKQVGDTKAAAAKSAPAKATAGKATAAKSAPAKGAAVKTGPAKSAAGKSAPGKAAAKTGPAKKSTPTRGRGKSPARRGAPVAAKRSTPWGMVGATALVVIFAVAAIGYAVVKVQQSKPINPQKGLADAAKIPGIFHEEIPAREHVADAVKYDRSPPIGGNHDQTWADCSGTVYAAPIRNENAVHTLEHGAVWITYQPNLASADVDKLKQLVDGKNYTLMSPYPGLKTPVSLQAWGYQLYLNTVDVNLAKRFLKDLRDNSANAPEPHGVCANPDFKAAPQPPGPTPTASVSTKPSGTATATPTKP
jgi:Protein of unknown function (DUF3105)